MSDKIYPLLKWLEIGQAVDWLQGLTESAVTPHDLISLCAAKQCAAYIDLNQSVSGTDDETWWQDVTGRGIQESRNPMALVDAGTLTDSQLVLFGEVTWTDDKGVFFREKIEWGASVVMIDVFPIFKPADIQALAHKMNGAANQPTATELEDLREQLKKANDSRENAWYLTDKYKVELETLRETAEQDRSSRESAWLRAGQADGQADELRQQLDVMAAKADSCFSAFESRKALAAELSDELKQERAARKVAESEARELREELEGEYQARLAAERDEAENAYHAHQYNDPPPPSVVGLTFPYSTKELEVMCRVALGYWADHTPDKRQPKQDAIQRAICDELGLDVPTTKTPPNKAIYLAMAIKPDGLERA